MALIKCPECGSEISDKAVRCPNCGIPAKVWNEDTSYPSIQPAVKGNIGKQETVVQEPEVDKKKGTIIKVAVAILVIVCLLGIVLKVTKDYTNNENQDNMEQDCKTAIAEHMNGVHGLSINTFESFRINENGTATATVEVTVAVEDGLGSMEMSTQLCLDEKQQIYSCSLCDFGVGYNGGAQKSEKSPTIYQDFILRKTEQLTGFVISIENDNYTEREITEIGRTYIDITTFINIEKMAGTPINSASVFQLYAVVNPNNKEDLFIAITGNSTGEIYRYDHSSIPHETTDNDLSENNTNTFSEVNEIIENNTHNNPYANETTQVTADELKKIEEMLNTPEVNGFVSRNFFDTVEDINLNLVFREYNYGESHAKEIDDEYLIEADLEELYTPLSVVSTGEIKKIYKKYTGKDISDSEIKNRLNFLYLPKYDVYCYMHGDTNRITVKCANGIKESDNTYIITIDYEDVIYYDDKEITSSVLTLKKNEDSYVFVSHIIKEAS